MSTIETSTWTTKVGLARVLRLHAHRPLPRYFDIDDGLDAVLAGTTPYVAGRQRAA